ncbi:MAG: hypothetical protein AAFX02_06160 [Pseudomonadota bacterium]
MSYHKGGQIIRTVKFADIKRIEAYKVDEITTDLICFDIWYQTSEGVDGMTIHEALAGFEELECTLSKLDGYDTAWQLKVIAPAFEECRTVIYPIEPDGN